MSWQKVVIYHGPINKVEEYFAGLWINIPDHINSLDYFIDILEGIIIPSGSSAVSYTELSVRGMLYNGYTMPPDMQQNGGTPIISSRGENLVNEINHSDAANVEQSFTGELWEGVKENIVMHHEKIRVNFLKFDDLSKWRTPNVF